jgi:hypothetical protein
MENTCLYVFFGSMPARDEKGKVNFRRISNAVVGSNGVAAGGFASDTMVDWRNTCADRLAGARVDRRGFAAGESGQLAIPLQSAGSDRSQCYNSK